MPVISGSLKPRAFDFIDIGPANANEDVTVELKPQEEIVRAQLAGEFSVLTTALLQPPREGLQSKGSANLSILQGNTANVELARRWSNSCGRVTGINGFFVLDTSIALKWFLEDENDRDYSLAILEAIADRCSRWFRGSGTTRSRVRR